MPPRRRDPANAGPAVRAALEPVLAWLNSEPGAGTGAGAGIGEPGAGTGAGAGIGEPGAATGAGAATSEPGAATSEPGAAAGAGAATGADPVDPVDPVDSVHPVEQPPRAVLANAVRVSLRTFADLHQGRAVEVRVPPFAAIQCLPGLTHTRGNPPNVIETDARGWLSLVTGRLSWSEALAADVVKASGHRTGEIAPLLPMNY